MVEGLLIEERTPARRRWIALRAPHRQAAWVLLAITALSVIAYARSLSLPFIADDYVQIQLGRDYGPVSAWSRLAEDALYRCRATSIVLTYWTERLFGLESLAYNLFSLALHIFNGWLVFALGSWRVLGWRVAAVAACFFAIAQQHQEAVIWYAALPELLVFTFALLSFLCWIRWLQSPAPSLLWYAAAVVSFVLALLSKESAVAVVALLALAVLIEGRPGWKRLLALAPFALLALLYFVGAFAARGTHLHFNDGTFSLQAPFWSTVVRSTARLLWFWGFISLVALAWWLDRRWLKLVFASMAWIAITLLPYSFLTYMPFVPSRHTYLASVGLALVVGAGLLAFAERFPRPSWPVWGVAALIVIHHCGYIWTKKQHQFLERAAPTERLLDRVKGMEGTVYVRCFPYAQVVADLALEYNRRNVKAVLLDRASTQVTPGTIDLCAP